MTLILASRNAHKIEELQQIMQPLGIELKSALDFPDLEEVIEDAPSLEGNALKKARYVAKATGLTALADDTGLEVNALNGAPGVFSARYAGEKATYEDNVNKLLEELAGLPPEKRTAQFRTVIALVNPDTNEERTFNGKCEGQILESPTGTKGFGYDPIFLPDGFDQSFAQMDASTKNQISHRGRAVQAFVDWLSTNQ